MTMTGASSGSGPVAVQTLLLAAQAARRRAASGRRTLFSNEVIHLDDSLLGPGRCAFVRVTSRPGLLAVYCKEGLAAATFLGHEVSLAVRGDQPTPHELTEGVFAALDGLERRKRALVGRDTCYRLVHGEADGFPGLVLDHYGPLLVAQSANQQGDFLLPWVVSALQRLFPGIALVERSTSQSRLQLGLQTRTRILIGASLPDEVSVRFADLALTFRPDRAQKTGLFLDQRQNLHLLRCLLPRVAAAASRPLRDWRVLDLCCYAGAWSAVAREAGCTSFVLVDQDAEALALAARNIGGAGQSHASSAADAIEACRGDVFETLGQLNSRQESFDLVVADPPAFARSRKNLAEALRAYARLTKMASRLVKPGGVLVVASCSRPVDAATFEQTVEGQLLASSGSGLERRWVLLSRGQQAPDHTVSPGVQGSEYLKVLFYQRLS